MTLTELQQLNEARAENRRLKEKLSHATEALATTREENEALHRQLHAARLVGLPSPYEVFRERVFIDCRGIAVRLAK